MAKISEWFLHNCLKTNAKKFHLFLNPFVDKTRNIVNVSIKSSYAEILLGGTIGSNLNFSEQMMYLCATANRKLRALSRVSKYINLKKHRVLMKSFIISQFSYCPLFWTIRWRFNSIINHICGKSSAHCLQRLLGWRVIS